MSLAIVLRALKTDTAKLAAEIGVSRRTVQRWAKGTNRPNRRNRELLQMIIERQHQIHSAAGHRWSQARDAQFVEARRALMTPAELAEVDARWAQLREAFAQR